MKNTLLYGMALGLLMASSSVTAQTRYLDEVFTDAEIEVTNDVVFGTNINFLFSTIDPADPQFATDVGTLSATADAGAAFPPAYYNPADASTLLKISDLAMDVYRPSDAADTETERPVIIYLHTGNFLPPPINGSMMGAKDDSLAVDFCTSWAKRGYVAVSIDYRLGWNPVAPDVQTRRGTLLNAVYRAIQDTKQCVRFMREDADDDNTYGIDTDNIALFGEGSGGYMAVAYVTLDKPETELFLEKFRPNPFDATVSYIDTLTVGPPSGIGFPNTLNIYRDNGYTAEVSFTANAGGALADESWLEAGDVPMVSFHAVRDDFAPFDEGTVIVPTTQEEVVDVQGSNFFIQKANDLGNNDVFAMLGSDPYTDRARSLYGEMFEVSNGGMTTINAMPEGLFPVVQPLRPFLTNISAPWQWWDPSAPLSMVEVAPGITTHMAQLQSNPNMSEMQSLAFQDTINSYMLPRLACALDLPGNPCAPSTPENDNVCDAIDIETDGTVYNADNTDATPDGEAPTCSFGGDGVQTDIWYAFVAPASGGVSIITIDNGGLQDTQVSVYSSSDGTCTGELTEVACGEDIAQGNYFTEFDATDLVAGDTYFIQIDGFDGATGTFDFSVTALPESTDCVDNTFGIAEDFESYDLAPIVDQSDDFIFWPATTLSSLVSNAQANSGTQSLRVGNDGADQVMNIIQDACAWETSWMMYIPSDSSGYFNVQGTGTPGGIFIVEALFNIDPAVIANPGTPGEGQINTTPVSTFTYPQDTWFEVDIRIDVDASLMSMYIDGTEVAAEIGINPGAILGGVNFFSANATTSYYVDDINVLQNSITGLFENENTAFGIFPNPTEGMVTISSDKDIQSVVVRNMLGAQVSRIGSSFGNTVEADLNGLETGVYLITVEIDGAFYTERVVKN